MRSTAFLLLICLFTACSQMRYIGIETYNPAEITYPENVRKILIVNNAVPQPEDSGYEYKIAGIIQDTAKAKADSAIVYACKALGTAIFETDFFNDVLLFHENTRKDDAFLTDVKLTQEQVQALCKETGADAVISFDRLLFDMDKVVAGSSYNYLIGMIDIRIRGVLRSYLPERNTPQATVLLSDSIFWAEQAGDMKILDLILPTPDNALQTAGEFIGNKSYSIFVPHWNRETRWYYTGSGARWKEASAYASNEKWENAAGRWQYIYDNSTGWKDKARAASNLALYYELKEDLSTALEWVSKSYEFYKNNAGDNNKYTSYQKVYQDVLTERIQADQKLNLQFGAE